MKHFLPFLLSLCALLFQSCQQSSTPHTPSNGTQPQKIQIAAKGDPESLDCRLVRTLESVTPLHIFYEGLTREEEAKPVLAIAKEVEISKDLKEYTFTLRESYWSNGDLLTAQDFAETWVTLLDPNFPAPNAYQLFVIKNAQEVKEGTLSAEHLGIKVLDEHRLQVTLVAPTPYFLSLVSCHFFFPVHKSLREHGANFNVSEEIPFVCNGPFRLQKWAKQNELVAEKNPLYWDASKVNLEEIAFVSMEQNSAFQLFDNQAMHWIGSPLSDLPTEALSYLYEHDKLHVAPADATYFFRYNVDSPLFSNQHLRRAFSLAINRKEMIDNVLCGHQVPASGIVPSSYDLGPTSGYFQDGDLQAAVSHFEAGLLELQLTRETLPKITLQYAAAERKKKIAQVVQQQWQKAFNIDVEIVQLEPKFYYDCLQKHQFTIALGNWFADYADPINYLELFKYKDTGLNHTSWENQEYVSLLNLSARASNPEKRQQLLYQAEKLLINEMPIIPLFYSTYNYAYDSELIEGIYFSRLGYLDFKYAKIYNH